MSKRSLMRATALLLTSFVTITQTAAASGLESSLPSKEGLVRYGCSVQGPVIQVDHGDPSGKMRQVWSVTFWAEHKGPFAARATRDWKLLYSFRKKRIKGLADCDKFMERVRKTTEEHPRSASGQLAAQRN